MKKTIPILLSAALLHREQGIQLAVLVHGAVGDLQHRLGVAQHVVRDRITVMVQRIGQDHAKTE